MVCRLIMSLAEGLYSTFAPEASLVGQMFIFRTIAQPWTLERLDVMLNLAYGWCEGNI